MKSKSCGLAAYIVPVGVGVAFVAGMVFQPPVAQAIDPGPKCQAKKLTTSAKQPKCRANVFAKSINKAEAPDAAKLTKCDDKFNTGFTKADDKGGVDCPTSGDASSIEDVLDSCLDDIVAGLGGAPGPGGDEAKCQSKKVKEAGKYAQCRLKADSKAIKKALPPDYTKCNDKLSAKWAKIEAKPPCLTNGDLGTVQTAVDVCQATVAYALAGLCGNGSVDAGEECDDGNNISGDGCSALCENEALIEYQQNFESLDQGSPTALQEDGWRGYANVYVPPLPWTRVWGDEFLVPNGGEAWSAIVTDQGGPEQGSQQLSIYSNYYDWQNHNVGNLIEGNVYQERDVVAGDVGRTLTFQVDAKKGNIEDICTALVFIKTLETVGWTTTNFIPADMTSIPDTWGTYSIEIDIDSGLVGQKLQYGFQTSCTNWKGSSIFYDNVVASTVPTP